MQSYQRRKINLAAGGFGHIVENVECDAKLVAVWLNIYLFDVLLLTEGKGKFFKK